ncbi:MAG: ribbon-helix-helix domain-containing protein [Gammaproteobacteria bacterium]|nr:ribbon-helix-helix domain-containing protein [Gammaproteobacteria bacterium]
MAKIFGIADDTKKHNGGKRVSIRMPKKMLTDFNEALDKEGYSTKKKSLWVNEALRTLFSKSNFLEIAGEEWNEKGDSNQINLTIELDNVSQLKKAINDYRREFNSERTDLQSKFIRSAIIQRVIKI